ncbi:MAG: tRNA lysidine(34) synthetase TilS [Planctomycetes bacterium]|nr:tRNA lysidine(34) synthetase TilS [Planctomycetota bacterium]
MPDASSRILPPPKGHPTVQQVLAAWRRLTGGRGVRDPDRRTLVACSGGADSSALVLALSAQPESVVVAHIEHDMRPAAESRRCADAARTLAHALSLPFVSARIQAKALPGNYEANARVLRYQALARLAGEQGCRAVATAHHAEDQLETMLLKLMRGAGPAGLAGIRVKRRLPGGVTLIRPMLSLMREDARSLCRDCGWVWSEDATNADISRRRAAIRATVLPALLTIDPRTPSKAADAARLALRTADFLSHQARLLDAAARIEASSDYRRDSLRTAPRIVLLTWLRSLQAAAPLRQLEAVAAAIASRSGETKQCALGARRLTVHRDRVTLL